MFPSAPPSTAAPQPTFNPPPLGWPWTPRQPLEAANVPTFVLRARDEVDVTRPVQSDRASRVRRETVVQTKCLLHRTVLVEGSAPRVDTIEIPCPSQPALTEEQTGKKMCIKEDTVPPRWDGNVFPERRKVVAPCDESWCTLL